MGVDHAALVLEIERLIEERIPLSGSDMQSVGDRVSVAQLVLAGVVALVAQDHGLPLAERLSAVIMETFESSVQDRLVKQTLS